MNNQDELFSLIKSMDKNEKGYFRKFSKVHGSSRPGNYLKLFDSLAAMSQYDEEKLRAKFKGEKFMNQLSVTKFYLKNMIIRSLRNYYEDRLPPLQKALALADGHIMLHKKMHESIPVRFEKELSSALSEDKFNSYTAWSSLYYNWLSIYGHNKKFATRAMELLLAQEEVLKRQLNFNAYFILSTEVYQLHISAGSAPSGKILSDMHKLLQNPLLLSPGAAISKTASALRNSILSILYEDTGQPDKARALLRAEIAQIENIYESKSTQAIAWLSALNALLSMLTKNDLDEIWNLLKKYEEVLHSHETQMTPPQRWHNQFGLLAHQASYYFYKRDAATLLQLTAKMKIHVKEHPQLAQQQEIIILTNEALALTELRQFDKALDIVGKMYNENYKMRTDLQLIAARLSIIIHIELGNFKLVETLLNRAAKLSKSTNRELAYQKQLYTYFKQIAEKFKGRKKAEIKAIAEKFLQFLETHVPDKLDYVNHWLQNVIER